MANLGIPANTIAILKKYEFIFKKKYGQNFLIDTHVLEKIINGSNINKESLVIEVGPGIGTLTQYLCENAGRVIAIEIDNTLIPILQDTLSSYNNIEIFNMDIMSKEALNIIKDKAKDYSDIHVVANLPYYITTPLIMDFLENWSFINNITVMIQKEVAYRMKATPDDKKDYGALSLGVQYYGEAYLLANVPPNCFMPRPNVSSAVINIKRYKEPLIKVKDEKLMFQLIRAAFNQRRKTLLNALHGFENLNYTKEDILSFINEAGFSSDIRGEKLSLKDFAKLSDIIYNKSSNV